MISLPNIWKQFSRPEVEPYQLPDAGSLLLQSFDALEEEPPEELPLQDQDALVLEAEEDTQNPPPPPPEKTPQEEAISFAQVQADSIVRAARQQADEILAQARAQAEHEAEELRAAAQAEGRREGYARGLEEAQAEGRRLQEAQAAEQAAEVSQFLDRAAAALDRQLDQNVNELRDLAMAVAEKVICVSLKSSSEVISRMIQTAVDKRKHREWVHIYIAECDAKNMTQIPASLADTLNALSDRVRIIPMGEDEPGTCIIEMPDAIIDASASTQLDNLRALLSDAPSVSAKQIQFGLGG